jgi:tRNA A-37 threonylcarbamoyl transferase component Bud32
VKDERSFPASQFPQTGPLSLDSLTTARWKLAPDIHLEEFLEHLGGTCWHTVKKRPSRKVYLSGDFYIKVYFYRGLLQRLKRRWCDNAVKEWKISRQVFNCCRATPEPVALCVSRDTSLFVNRSVDPCQTLGTFIDRNWEHLTWQQRYQITDKFSAFMLEVFNCGLFQTDFNLGNLLIKDDTWEFFIIDMQAARLEKQGNLSTKEIAANLAFLLPVFPKIENRYKLRFFINILKHHPGLKEHLWFIQEKAFQKMRAHWLKKGSRNLKKSAIKNYFHNRGGINGYLDVSAEPNIQSYLRLKPDELFKFTEKILKTSNRAKLAVIQFEGRRYILKRYNLKNWRHRLKRLLAPSLAWRIWKANHLIKMRGISTSHLLAAVDVGTGAGYRCSFALYDYIDDVSEGYRHIQDSFLDDRKRPYVMRRLAKLAWELHQKGIHHGDLKASNIIWSFNEEQENLKVIDLDAVRFNRFLRDGQRIADLKNLASYFLMLDPDPAKTDLLFDEYVNLHPPWQHRRDRLYRSFRTKALRQLKHRLKREESRSPFPKQLV